MAKKIFFSDRYGLTQAVLEGRKTMTRRILEVPIKDFNSVRIALLSEENTEVNKMAIIKKYAKYQVGEVVAVAQRYKDVIRIANSDESVWQFLVEKGLMQSGGAIDIRLCTCAGYDNKMFVKASWMPYRIRISDIKAEKLQDISDVDAIKEGIYDANDFIDPGAYTYFGSTRQYKTPREAFAALIDRISGKGTWERNPWVFAYSFELIK